MADSKAWNWRENTEDFWKIPSAESYYCAARWKDMEFTDLLDFGCGLGRHAIHFAKSGFSVSAFDLSADAVKSTLTWAEHDNLSIPTVCCDMQQLPYADASFDCLFAYHVISHTDSQGILRILSEIRRVLRVGGEAFVTLCSKDTWSFRDAGYPKIDENTVIKTCDGPEYGIPHFYVNMDDIESLFAGFELQSVRHTDDCFWNGKRQNSKHYFILARKIQ